jgi:signal transduction histidine kinase
VDGTSSGVALTANLVAGLELVVCLAVAVLLARRWVRHRSAATASAFGIFAVLALIIATGFFEVDGSAGAGLVWTKAVVVLLLAVPYLLVLFARSLRALGATTHALLAGLYAAEVVVTLAIPALPDADETERPGWVLAYTAFVLVAWTVQSGVAAVALWRAGRDQSSVVRHRMRSLSVGAVLLAVTLVVSGAVGNAPADPVRLAVLFAGLIAILLFALAFLLPASLRLVWRQADLAALSEAERGLMTALSSTDVGETIVPVLAEVLGGGAALLDARGEPVLRRRLTEGDLAAHGPALAALPPDGPMVRYVGAEVLAARLGQGWLVVQAGRLAPVFGDDEAVLLGRVATLVDLALQRVALFEQEQASRLAAEAANAELETLLYSVSHDLRSPLISVLGYLDFLRAEHGEQLTGDGPHYLERITVNAVYMQSLISDLLELSRIGRSDPPVAVLDLHAVAEQVADAARLSSPAADVAVVGSLPRAVMSDVRARQLLTNLVDNALKHAGRDDVHVTVSGRRGPDGELVL